MTVEFHPLSLIFPLMTGDEFRKFTADIKANGLNEPIVTFEGKILDGRNRFLACEAAGVTPRFVGWDGRGGSAARFVFSENSVRRHLTTSQRAAVGVEMMPLLREAARDRQATSAPGVYGAKPLPTKSSEAVSPQGGNRLDKPTPPLVTGDTRDIAAEAVGVSGWSVGTAAVVQRTDPEAFQRIKDGKTTVGREASRLKGIEPKKVPASPVQGSKRRATLDNSARERLVVGVSQIRGICDALRHLSLEYIRSGSPADERKAMADSARKSSSFLREFAKSIGDENDTD